MTTVTWRRIGFNASLFVVEVNGDVLCICDNELKCERIADAIDAAEKISLCPHCYCMTKTFKGKCGKCKRKKTGKVEEENE